MSPDYKRQTEREMALIDQLPADWREIVHEFGSKRVVQMFVQGFSSEYAVRTLKTARKQRVDEALGHVSLEPRECCW